MWEQQGSVVDFGTVPRYPLARISASPVCLYILFLCLIITTFVPLRRTHVCNEVLEISTILVVQLFSSAVRCPTLGLKFAYMNSLKHRLAKRVSLSLKLDEDLDDLSRYKYITYNKGSIRQEALMPQSRSSVSNIRQ